VSAFTRDSYVSESMQLLKVEAISPTFVAISFNRLSENPPSFSAPWLAKRMSW
jgi:hypothetical protein